MLYLRAWKRGGGFETTRQKSHRLASGRTLAASQACICSGCADAQVEERQDILPSKGASFSNSMRRAPLTLSEGEEEDPERELPGLDEHQRHEDSDSARTPWA